MVAIRALAAAAAAATVGRFARFNEHCSISNYTPSFPSGQTALVAPSGSPKYVGIAFGVQNYTCSSANTYSSAGAFAEVLDASCLTSTDEFSTLQTGLYNVWNSLVPQTILEIDEIFHEHTDPEVLGQHFFQPNPVTGTGLSPVWDFRSNSRFRHESDAYVLGKVNASTPSPQDSTKDVAWLHVLNVQGGLADEVFRYDTVGGQPPSSCTYGKDTSLSVNYVAKYAFYGGSDSA